MDATPSPPLASPVSPAAPHAAVAALPTLGALTPRALAPSGDAPETPPLVVRVALRTGRATLLTLAVVGMLVSLTLVFGTGVELARFDAASKSAAQQQRLVDDYNSHSASVAAMFGTPVELFVVMAVRAVVLRFFAPLVMNPRHPYAIMGAALALSAAVGYLVNNGFNALNVQLHAMPIEPRITDADLSIGDVNFFFSATGLETSSSGYFVSEAATANPLTNTVLRNLVLPFSPKPFPLACDYEASQFEYHTYVPDDVLEFGFPQREWQSRMLPRALKPSSLRIVVNASKANREVAPPPPDGQLPMNASVAADLLLNALMLSSQYMPWGKERVWLDEKDVAKRYLTPKSSTSSRVASAAEIARLLPENAPAIPETTQREWFLRETHAIVRRKFNGSANTSLDDIALEFTHVDLTPSIAFDAVTFEVQVDPAAANFTWSGSVVDNRTGDRHYQFDAYNHCGPWPTLCTFIKPPYAAAQAPNMYVDTPVQIHAFAMCADEAGVEALRAKVSYTTDNRVDYRAVCPMTSNSSILVVSIAKRLVADALIQNASANASGVFPVDPASQSPEYPLSAVATNLRKVFSFTVARLSWQLQNLSVVFNATCDTQNPTRCLGLHYELQDSIVNDREKPPRQSLLVGNWALPDWDSLALPEYDSYLPVRLRPLSLVRVHEPPRQTDASYYPIFTGDILLPHNIKDLQWDLNNHVTGRGCFTFHEDRQSHVTANHMYMEHGLQPTYTASMFYLFQDAAVRDVISLVRVAAGKNLSDDAGDRQSLAFKNNTLEMVVWISIPHQNVALSLAGCVVLLGSLVAAILWPWCNARRRHVDAEADPLQHISAPHEIARVMLDEAWFPWLLLHRHVVDARDPSKHRRIADFRIDALAMHHTRDEDHRVETKVPPKRYEC